MTVRTGSKLSNYEIRREGWKALTERLGVSGAVRFLMQYDPGMGDYSQERREILADLSWDEAIRAMKEVGARHGSIGLEP